MIIDTHTHFGKPSEPNELLHRTALPDIYMPLASGEGVTGTIVVEARRGLDEIQWLLDMAEENPFIVGIVGDIDLGSEDFGDALGRFVGSPTFLGVRLHDACCYGSTRLLDANSTTESSKLLRNAGNLAANDLELDVHMSHESIDGLIRVVKCLPDLRVVINHIAEGNKPLSEEKANPRWAEAMYRVAESSSVYCKVSGLVQMTRTVPAPQGVDYYRPTLDVLWEAFGEDRLVYGSNWPQIEAVSDFGTAHQIVASYFGEKGDEASQKFFWKNAKAVYRFVART